MVCQGLVSGNGDLTRIQADDIPLELPGEPLASSLPLSCRLLFLFVVLIQKGFLSRWISVAFEALSSMVQPLPFLSPQQLGLASQLPQEGKNPLLVLDFPDSQAQLESSLHRFPAV